MCSISGSAEHKLLFAACPEGGKISGVMVKIVEAWNEQIFQKNSVSVFLFI